MSLAVAFKKEIKAKLETTVRNTLIAATRAAYLHIQSVWPVHSGYSKANNKISITGQPITHLEPAQRNWRAGSHVATAAAITSRELGKLSRIEVKFGKRPRTIIIGNPVEYAAELSASRKKISGTSIYEQAAKVADTVANALGK